MKKTTLIALLAVVSVIACKKVKDTIPPVITITAPTSTTMVAAGDSVQVAFTVTDSDLHEVGYIITNTATNDTLFLTKSIQKAIIRSIKNLKLH